MGQRASDSPYLYQSKDDHEQLDVTDVQVLRGDAFSDSEGYMRCARRVRRGLDFRDLSLGFRMVVSPF